MKNYRISFDYEAEDPTQAVIHLLGIIQDPAMQDLKFNWLVKDLDSGEEHQVTYSVNELEAIAREDTKRRLDEMGGKKLED